MTTTARRRKRPIVVRHSCQWLSNDPDVYLTTSDSGTTLATLRHDHLTKRLQAVRKGRFGILRAKLAEPGPQIGEALVQVAKILHPEAFR